MIWNYPTIEKNKKFEIIEGEINRGSHFNNSLKETIISKLQEHYFENWEIKTNSKKQSLIFILKKEPEYKDLPILKDKKLPEINEIENKPDEIENRADILDIR